MVKWPESLALPEGFVPDTPPGPPVPPRDAATVVLLRDGRSGPEVFLQQRVRGMPFAAGMTVFPGGSVDLRDADPALNWSGPDPDWWGQRFGCAPELAKALVSAAVRETFEESGVLLAGSAADSVVPDTTAYFRERAALVSGEQSLARFLSDAGLVLRADLLRPWANWVTPEAESRRYDTRFFLAVLPTGQRADGSTTEAAAAYWSTPSKALDDWERGDCALLPPTWMTLTELAEYGSVAAALEAERALRKVQPEIVRRSGTWRVVFPDREDQ
jgi:8-oxo-dGTP pyrophosphatase MutT (NUDIX family)